jgi:hypothetical protein
MGGRNGASTDTAGDTGAIGGIGAAGCGMTGCGMTGCGMRGCGMTTGCGSMGCGGADGGMTDCGSAGGGTAGCCGTASGRTCAAACAAVATSVAIELASVPVVCVTPAESPGLPTRTEIAMLQPTQTVVPVADAVGGGASGQFQCQFQMIVTAPAVGSGVGGESGVLASPSQFQYQFQIKV